MSSIDDLKVGDPVRYAVGFNGDNIDHELTARFRGKIVAILNRDEKVVIRYRLLGCKSRKLYVTFEDFEEIFVAVD